MLYLRPEVPEYFARRIQEKKASRGVKESFAGREVPGGLPSGGLEG